MEVYNLILVNCRFYYLFASIVICVQLCCLCLSGNDLARVLRWGAGYSGEDPYNILVSVDEAEEVQMDRWTILLDAQEMTEDGKENGFLEPPKVHNQSLQITINMISA